MLNRIHAISLRYTRAYILLLKIAISFRCIVYYIVVAHVSRHDGISNCNYIYMYYHYPLDLLFLEVNRYFISLIMPVILK